MNDISSGVLYKMDNVHMERTRQSKSDNQRTVKKTADKRKECIMEDDNPQVCSYRDDITNYTHIKPVS